MGDTRIGGLRVLGGTLDEHRAAEVVIAHKLNGAFSSCIADRGYPRPWTESVWPAPVPKDSLLYSFWAAGRLDGYYSQKVITAEVGQRIESAANAHEARGEEAAAERDCRAEHPGAGDDAVGEIRDPAVVRELTKGWSTALAPVLAAGGDPASYDECMASNGILATLGVESTDEARRALSSPMPPGSVPLGDEPSTPEWDAYLADERAFVDADWTCREEVRRGLGDGVAESVESFETEYADQIDAARQHWESVRRQAEALGWSPAEQPSGNPG